MKKDDQGPNKKKEKVIMYLTAAFVLGAMTITGVRLRNVGLQSKDYQLDVPKADNPLDQGTLWDTQKNDYVLPKMDEEAELDYAPVEEETTIVSTTKIHSSVGTENNSNTAKTDNTLSQNKGKAGVGAVLDSVGSSLVNQNSNTLVQSQSLSEGQLLDGQLPGGELLGEGQLPGEELLPEEEVTLVMGEGQRMLAPIAGEILIPYNMEHTVYFTTLDQYKYNPAVIYSASVGQEAVACAKARVSEIQNDRELGQVVVLELGSGYFAKYGQLENLQVSVGQIVEAGSVLGTVAEPTGYYSLDGCNLYFALTRDGASVDPMQYFEGE